VEFKRLFPGVNNYRLGDILYRTWGIYAQSSDRPSRLELGCYTDFGEACMCHVNKANVPPYDAIDINV